MANNKLVTIHQATSQRGGLQWNAWDGTFPLCYVILTNNVNEMASYLSPICTVVRGVKASLKVHPLCAGERIRASPTKRLWFFLQICMRSLAEKSEFSKLQLFQRLFRPSLARALSHCLCVFSKKDIHSGESSPSWTRVGAGLISHHV